MKPYVESIDNINLQFSKNQKYEIIQVNNTKTKRWQDVRVEILNTVVNQESLDIHIRDDKNEILITKINYNSDLLKEEGDIRCCMWMRNVEFFFFIDDFHNFSCENPWPKGSLAHGPWIFTRKVWKSYKHI